MSAFFATSAVLLYAMAALMLLGKLLQVKGPNKTLSIIMAGIAVACHFGFLINIILLTPGQDMSITNMLSLVSCLITFSMLTLAFSMPNLILLPVVFIFSAFAVLVSLLFPTPHIMDIGVKPGLFVHITLSLIAYCVLVMAFLYAVQMAYISYKLKKKGAAIIHSTLPPLTRVEGILFKLLVVGTGLLVVALVSGFVFLDDMFSKAYAHKTVLSLLALFVFSFLLIGQKVKGWRDRQAMGFTVVGVMLLSLAYFGSKFVQEILL